MKKVLLGIATAASLAYARFFGPSIDGTAWDVKVKATAMASIQSRPWRVTRAVTAAESASDPTSRGWSAVRSATET